MPCLRDCEDARHGLAAIVQYDAAVKTSDMDVHAVVSGRSADLTRAAHVAAYVSTWCDSSTESVARLSTESAGPRQAALGVSTRIRGCRSARQRRAPYPS